MKMCRIVKKIFSVMLVLCMAFSLCACFEPLISDKNESTPEVSATPSGKEPTANEPVYNYDSIKSIDWVRVSEKTLGIEALEFILLNFGLRVTEINVKYQNMKERIELLFAANITPALTSGLSVDTMNELSQKGLFCDLSSETEALADYFLLWNSWHAGWEYTKKIIYTDPENERGLYGIVPINRKITRAWIYNKAAFDGMSTELPTTLNGLYEALLRYSESKGTTAPLWVNENEGLQMTAILNAYGLTDEAWQLNENGEVFYLYADERWYEALEWLDRFEDKGLVPTDKQGNLRSYTASEYANAKKNKQQIVEFTNAYNTIYLQDAYGVFADWQVGTAMIAADSRTTPVISANIPYINECTCIAETVSFSVKKQILAFLNWCCTDSGNMWANFGIKGETYKINSDGSFEFLKFYSTEMTPELSEEGGKVGDSVVGRMFTTVPWDKVKIDGIYDRYTPAETFLSNSGVKTVLPIGFSSMQSVLGNSTELWDYENIRSELSRITEEFIKDTQLNGFDG